MTELLVGTKKGLFVLEGTPGDGFEVTARAFAGEPVEYAMRDPRTGRILAGVISPFYGPKLFVAEDPNGEWEQAKGVALPEGGDEALERIWVIVPARPTASCTSAATPACCSSPPTAALTLGAHALAVGAPDAAGLAAGRRRPVPALDRAVAGRARTGWRSRSPRSASG